MLKVLNDRVLIKVETNTNVTSSGIYVPTVDVPNKGSVIKVGDGRLSTSGELTPLTVQPGDNVIFSSFAGTEVRYNDEAYLLLRENDILAIIEKAKEERACND